MDHLLIAEVDVAVAVRMAGGKGSGVNLAHRNAYVATLARQVVDASRDVVRHDLDVVGPSLGERFAGGGQRARWGVRAAHHRRASDGAWVLTAAEIRRACSPHRAAESPV